MGLRGRKLLPYGLLLPAIVALVMFSVYPFVSGIWYSFTNISYIGDKAHLVGLVNYQRILAGDVGAARFFRQALEHSVVWTVVVVAGQFAMGLLTALVLNERFPARALFRTAILVPIAIPTVVLALTWEWLYDPLYGPINFCLQHLGLLHGPKAWVGQPNSPIWPLMIVAIWRGFPFMGVMLLSGLQGIQADLYEAARVDGANVVHRFRYVTLPQLRTTITIAVMLHVIWWWNHFDIIRIMGSGGGQFSYESMTLPILAWYEAFAWSHLSRGAAISIVSMLALSLILVWNVRREIRSVRT